MRTSVPWLPRLSAGKAWTAASAGVGAAGASASVRPSPKASPVGTPKPSPTPLRTLVPTEVQRECIVDIAVRWGTGYDTVTRSFVNIIATPKGGTHLNGFERGMTIESIVRVDPG